MALVAHYELEMHQMDVKPTFLDEELEDKVYMDQFKGFSFEEKFHIMYKFKVNI